MNYIERYDKAEWSKVVPDIYGLLKHDVSYFIGTGLTYGLATFSSFLDYKESKGKIAGFSAICTYIVAMYNIFSPVRKHSSDILGMKREAAMIAEFPLREDGSFFPPIETMLLGNNYIINNMILEYVMYQHGTEYAVYVANMQALYFEMNKMMTGEHDAKTIDLIRKLREDMQMQENKILNYDSIGDLRKRLYQSTAGKLKYSPEQIAIQLNNGERPILAVEVN